MLQMTTLVLSFSTFYPLWKTAIGNKIKDLILLKDFKKAFDSINHDFIKNTMENLNFGEDMIQWVSFIFNDREAMILIVGHLTNKIFLR